MAGRSLNKATIIGNLTRDPNLRYTGNGTAVCSFGVATNRSWTPSDGGERVEQVEYHNIVAWSKLAEICDQLLGKGDKVLVEGRIQTRDWQTDDGQDRKTTEIVIDNMMLLVSRSGKAGNNYGDDDYQGDSNGGRQSQQSSKKSNKNAGASAKDDDVSSAEDIADDIPF